MIFNTWLFALFGIATFALYWKVVPVRFRPEFLMVAGIVFYVASIPVYTLLILALALITFAIGRLIIARRAERNETGRWLLTLGILASTGVLVYFKYAKLFNGVCSGGCIKTLPDLIVPLAVSFFTFEFVHVLVDVYLGKIEKLRFRDFMLFTLFFPTMVAGPIKRYQNFVPQIDVTRSLHPLVAQAGIYRILLGLAKKMVVADSMNPLVAPLVTPGPAYGPLDYWLALVAYAVKIYFDFTGYSDIAIGCAALLGYQILENFDRPYRSPNISQFWRRWHMSLSSWIRDYLFIPLGGSRNKTRAIFNLIVVMGLAGLWHGAAWHFVVWGLYQGAGLTVHRLWNELVNKRLGLFMRPARTLHYASVAATFLFVTLGWSLFASPSVGAALQVYRGLVTPAAPIPVAAATLP